MTEWNSYEAQSAHRDVEYPAETSWGPNPFVRWVVRPIACAIYYIAMGIGVSSIVLQTLFYWSIALAIFLLVLFGATTYLEHLLGITY